MVHHAGPAPGDSLVDSGEVNMFEIFNPYNGKTLGWTEFEWSALAFIDMLGDYGIPADYDDILLR
jgi:hypothetical protein